MKHTTIQLVPRKDKKNLDIAIYYSVKVDDKIQQFRKNTGYSIDKKFLNKTGEGLGRISTKHLDYPFGNVVELQSKFETILDSYFKQTGTKPPVDYLKSELSKGYEANKKKYESMIQYFDGFINEKKSKSHSTLTSYVCLKKNLIDFEKDGFRISFQALGYDWYKNFITFLFKTHSNNSANQKLINFGAFLTFCYSQDLEIDVVKQKTLIKKVKDEMGIHIKRYQNWIDLTNDELQFLYQYNTTKLKEFNPKEVFTFEKVKEIFLLTSVTGMRFSDTISMSLDHIRKINNVDCIDKKAIKTKKEFKVELNDYAKMVLEKYNYDLSWVNYNTYLGKLKEFFKIFFEDYKKYYDNKTGLEYELKADYKRKVGKEEITERVFKYELVGTHAGRKSFLNGIFSNNNSNLSQAEIMVRCGWNDVSMLNSYLNTERITVRESNLIKLY